MGAVNGAIPALMFNFGFSRLPASLVTLTLALAPVFTALTAHLAFHDDRFTKAKVLGLALSFTGVIFLAGMPAGSGGRSLLAFGVTFAGAILTGASLVWVRRMATRNNPMAVLAPMQVGAAIVAASAAAIFGHPLWDPGTDRFELIVLALMGVGTYLTYVTSLKASKLAPASRVGLMGYIVPLVGVAGGILLFDEPLTINLAVGGALILAGLALVGRANRRLALSSPG